MAGVALSALLVVLVASGAVAPAPAAVSRDPADLVAARIDAGFMREVIEDIVAIGSTDIGFRTAVSPEDAATARYIVSEMDAIGLERADVEVVPVDMWRFLGASLTVTAEGRTWTFRAASQGGVPATPPGGLTGGVVYAGKGRAMDYEATGLDPAGKLVLADWDADEVWTNHIAMEAVARGALGTIITVLPGGDYYQAPGAIGSFDSVCDPALCGTFITIAKEDALTILDLLERGPVSGTMTLDVEVDEDTVGYNTIAFLPGSTWPEELVLFNAHHDAWFQGAIDDTSGVAVVLAIAKAMTESGYRPARTLVFMTATGEEWGVLDTYYDWLIGSWYRIVAAHPEWQSRAAALLNVEGSGFAGDPLEVNVNRELRSYLARTLGRNRHLVPYGVSVQEVYSWNELWTYAAAGVPGFTFSSAGGTYSRTIYHTDQDTVDKIDWGYLRSTAELIARVAVELDRSPVQPWDFGRRADHLRDNVDLSAMGELLGRSDPTINRVRDAMGRFDRAALAADALRGRLPASIAREVEFHLREALRIALSEFTGLSVWDTTVYPHQQPEMDAIHLGMAMDDLRRGEVQGGLRHLEWWVGQSWYIPRMSYGPFAEEMAHHDPALATGDVHLGGPKEIAWGGQGHLPPYWDLWHPYTSVRAKAAAGNFDFSEEVAILEATRDAAVQVYRERLGGLAGALDRISTHLEMAAAAAG